MEQFMSDNIEHFSLIATILPIVVVIAFTASVFAQFLLSRKANTVPGLTLAIVWIALGVTWAIGWNLFVLSISQVPVESVAPIIAMAIIRGIIIYSIPGLILLGIHVYQQQKLKDRRERNLVIHDL